MDPDPDFSGSNPDFRQIWIQIGTQENKFNPDLVKYSIEQLLQKIDENVGGFVKLALCRNVFHI